MFQLNMYFSLLQMLELMIRMVVAAVCGGIIGFERSRRFKDAGVRTHCLVAAAAATMMIVSKYGFTDLTDMAGIPFPGTREADPARIAAQVVSGISFLGVGVIYRDRKFATKGLTTAAGIWAVAGVGLAVGAGMYLIGLFLTLFVLALQFMTHRFALGKDKYVDANLYVIMQDKPQVLESMQEHLENRGIFIVENEATRPGDGMLHCVMLVRMESRRHLQRITNDVMKDPMIQSFKLAEEN